MIIPIKDRVVIALDQRKTQTESGLTIPEGAQDREVYGVVLATGAEVIPDIQPGMRVLIGKHDGFTIDSKYVDGYVNECIVVRDEHIRAIIE
jgi:co-chaperonin GroES (HSP10)